MRVNVRRKKSSEEDYIEKLEKEIRELKSINRSLMKQLKKQSKGVNRRDYKEYDRDEEDKVKKNQCFECGKGTIKVSLNIPGREIITCTICDHRKVRKLSGT